MPDERAGAEAWNGDYAVKAARGETRDWRSRDWFEAGWRAEVAFPFTFDPDKTGTPVTVSPIAEAPDADEDVLWERIYQRYNATTEYARRIAREEVEALIAYRERRYESVVAAANDLVDLTERWNNTDEFGGDESKYAPLEAECYRTLIDALRALSERSDG